MSPPISLYFHITEDQSQSLAVIEVDPLFYNALVCQAGNISGKKVLPCHDIWYVGNREIGRRPLQEALAGRLNVLLAEGRVW